MGGRNQYLREGCFTSTGLATDENGSASNLAVSDHAEDDTSCSPSIGLNKKRRVVRGTVARNIDQRSLEWAALSVGSKDLPGRPYLGRSYVGQASRRDRDL